MEIVAKEPENSGVHSDNVSQASQVAQDELKSTVDICQGCNRVVDEYNRNIHTCS